MKRKWISSRVQLPEYFTVSHLWRQIASKNTYTTTVAFTGRIKANKTGWLRQEYNWQFFHRQSFSGGLLASPSPLDGPHNRPNVTGQSFVYRNAHLSSFSGARSVLCLESTCNLFPLSHTPEIPCQSQIKAVECFSFGAVKADNPGVDRWIARNIHRPLFPNYKNPTRSNSYAAEG